MVSFDIAAKANAALVLPSLLIAGYLQQTAVLPTVTKTFHEGVTIAGKDYIQLASNGKTLSDKSVVSYLMDLATANTTLQRTSSAREWVERSSTFTATGVQVLKNALLELDHHLTLRTFIVGYGLSVADVAVWATIRGNRIAHSLAKQAAGNVLRWFNYVEDTNPWIPEIVAELTVYESKERAAASAAGASYDIDLPDTQGPVVTRFPPEPSGYLHIGHAKAALLNDFFAHKHPGGTLICRFDDTNPTKESTEFQDSILEDLKSIGIVPDKTSYSSDYFQDMYQLAIKLIKSGKAFADDSELGKGGEDRKNRLPSKRRDLSIEDTLQRFQEMKTGSEEGQRWCLRARIAFDSPNGTLRDPVIFRCNLIRHHRTGTQWKIYPTYDFCAPILDSIENVTVALRTNEYRDRNAQYEWMQDALGLRKVAIWDFSRMNFIRTVLSKRKLTRIVNDGKVWGWDDPRMPTVRGILRRGMAVAPLREFILKQGPSRNMLNLEWGAFWALNKKYIDPQAPRHTAIAQEHAVHCRVNGINGLEVALKPKYVKNIELGSKKVLYGETIVLEQADAQAFQQGEEITLMNWGNAYVRGITMDQAGEYVVSIDFELNPAGDVKKTKKKVSWLAAINTNLISVDLVTFDHLVTKDKLEKNDELERFLTPDTEFRSRVFADCNVTELPHGTVVQFERKGYYKLDVPYKGEGSTMVFFNIPSGKD